MALMLHLIKQDTLKDNLSDNFSIDYFSILSNLKENFASQSKVSLSKESICSSFEKCYDDVTF